MKLESLLHYLDDYLEVAGFPDYPRALNGLQVEGPATVQRIAAAVDASEATIRAAVDAECDLLLVHHGLFWGGLRPVTGRAYRKLRALLENRIAVYACHLPLDAHEEVGNCAVLAREVGIELEGRFGSYEGREIGWWGRLPVDREELRERVARAVRQDVRLIPGGPERVEKVGVVTGGAGSMIEDAARAGLDAFVTGEGAHHNYFDAMEIGLNVYLAGHYATETWGVRALARHVEESFGIPWVFLDLPTGL